MEFSGVWTGYRRFTKHTKSSVQLCEVSRSIGLLAKPQLSHWKSLICSPFHPSLSGYCCKRPRTVPSACQASPVIPNESWAALNTLLLSSFRGDPGATRHRQTWAGWECWAGDFCRIYTYIRFQGLKLTSPSPRSAPRRKGCQFQLEAAGVTPKGAAEATRSTEWRRTKRWQSGRVVPGKVQLRLRWAERGQTSKEGGGGGALI